MARGSQAVKTLKQQAHSRGYYPSGIVDMRRNAEELPTKINYPANALLVVGGLPGVGKTTMLDRLNPQVTIFSPDKTAEQYNGKVVSRINTIRMLNDISDELNKGNPAIIDTAAIRPHLREDYIELAYIHDIEVHLLFIHESVRVAREGQRKRQERYLRDKQMRTYSHFQQQALSDWFTGQTEGFTSIIVTDRFNSANLQNIAFNK